MSVVIFFSNFCCTCISVILELVSVLCSAKHFTFDLRIYCRFVCVNRVSVTTSVQTGTKMFEGGIAVD
jgi:hypothetical protein